MLEKIFFYSFALLFFFVPLFWSPLNYELFEYNKMIAVYFLTVVIVGSWTLKIINKKSLILSRTPLDIPLLLFLLANILSTIFSIDRHISIWGYYSRQNGGLLSLISYLLLYWAFVSNINKDQAIKLLKIGLVSALIISVWGILEHFGLSPSCVMLRGEFNTSCWVQDVQARVFATLGQPNWMAAYLVMLIFPTFYFFLTAKTRQLIYYLLSLITIYLAFTFTYSRGASLGLIAGFFVFMIALLINFKFIIFNFNSNFKFQISNFKTKIATNPYLNRLFFLLIILLIINLLFGSALTDFKLLSKFAPPPRPDIVSQRSVGTQLETGGTESGQIRLIVWQGALDIFKHYPIFGSGVETFALSYYNFRPIAHNLVSEWDFLYNKAHNEYLNYLATTGIVGFTAYLGIIISFIIWCIKRIMNKEVGIKHNSYSLILTAFLASYISYLVQNFFGFSVVIIALFFFLFPAIAFVISDSLKVQKTPKLLLSIFSRRIYIKSFKVILVLTSFYLLFSILRMWNGDRLFAIGENSSAAGNAGRAYNFLSDAVSINPAEPLYRLELGYAAAASALALSETDATLSAELKKEADYQTKLALSKSPRNVSYLRTATRTYLQLSGLEAKYTEEILKTIDQTIKLAPTDPKPYYNKAIILESEKRYEEAILALEIAIKLKPNYREAYITLAQIEFEAGQKEKAIETLKKVLKFIPGDPDVLNQLKEWGVETD